MDYVSTSKVKSSQMQQLLTQAKQVQDRLNTTEKNIYDLETKYLEDTFAQGNLSRGWEGFIDNRSASLARRTAISREERIFSLSSVTSPLHQNVVEDDIHSVSSYESTSSKRQKRNRKKKQYYEDELE
ncbi:hypothetical protein WA158_001090 [Blastocystis sp. Blastoise]